MGASELAEKIQIIVPVYNEGENIVKTLQEIGQKVSIKNEILIIYDAANDTTLPILKKYIEKNRSENIFLIKNKYGQGVLNAIKTGFEFAQEEIVLLVMADSSDDLAVVDEMYSKIRSGFDIVCGSRYMPGGAQIGGPKIKQLLSKIAGLSLYYIFHFPTHDVSNSFKMYRKSVVDKIKIESLGGFEIGVEIVAKAYFAGYKITEVPSIWREREKGESKFKLWKWLPSYLHWYFFVVKNTLIKQ